MVIDAHQHLWRIGQNGHEWPTPDLTAIHRDFVVADLERTVAPCGVSGTVLVQSQPSDADTDWMLDVAAVTPLILGVVGWVDVLSPGAPARIANLARRPKLKGLRPMLQGLANDWILQDAAQPALAAMVEHGLTFDALVFTRHLAAIEQLARDYPSLPIIIDHGAKPPIAAADPSQTGAWRDAISRISQRPNVACKLSGLVTEAAPHQTTADIVPYADHLLEAFGADRLMWGSDWPVVLLKDSYCAWLDVCLAWLDSKPAGTRDRVMTQTACHLYSLERTRSHA